MMCLNLPICGLLSVMGQVVKASLDPQNQWEFPPPGKAGYARTPEDLRYENDFCMHESVYCILVGLRRAMNGRLD